MQSLDANAFRTLETTLEYLDLEHNQLPDTQPAALAGLHRLQYLYFTANRLRHVHTLPSTLLVLSLAGNHLTRIPYASLQRCTQLTYLNVGYNQIADMGAAAATVMADASAVSTTVVTSAASTTNAMFGTDDTDSSSTADTSEPDRASVDFAEDADSSTHPTPTPSSYTAASEAGFVGWAAPLQTLLLRNNKLTELPADAFLGLAAIREISLSFNDLHWIHPNTFDAVADTLQILELSFGVRSSDADGDFPVRLLRPLHQLVWLGLDNNRLTGLPDQAFTPLGRLRYVNLAFNRLERLPAAGLFDAETHGALVEVDLSFNLLAQLRPFAFDSCAALERIHLAHNRLHTLHGRCFNNLPQLQTIDLAHNRLVNISAQAFALLPRLRRLLLQHNHLVRLSFGWFRDVAVVGGGGAGGIDDKLLLNVSWNRIERIVMMAERTTSDLGRAASASGEAPAIAELDVSNNRLELVAMVSLGTAMADRHAGGSVGGHTFGGRPLQ